MSRGLGKLQSEIKRILQQAFDAKIGPLKFADIRAVFIMSYGGSETDKLRPDFERSLKRSLKALVERGDVLIVHGKGGQKDPFTYTTVEALTDETDTDEAKRVLKELAAAVAGIPDRVAAKLAKLSARNRS